MRWATCLFFLQIGEARAQAFDSFADKRDFDFFVIADGFARHDDAVAEGGVMHFVAGVELRGARGGRRGANGGRLAAR